MKIRALHTERGGISAPPETVNTYGIKVETRNLDGTVTTRDYSVSETPLDFPREVAQVFLSTFNGRIVEVPDEQVVSAAKPSNEIKKMDELEPVGVAAGGEPKPRFRRKRQ